MVFTVQALLFDLDGVLVDSAPAVERSWHAWALMHGFDPAQVVAQAHGRRSIETIRAVAPHLDADRENAVIEKMEIADRDGVIALPGAAGLLRSLPSEHFAIVTSATRPLAVARLGYAGLTIPANMITADDVVQGKPFPEPYLKGAILLGCAPRDCMVFEDTPAGISAGRGAGTQVVALETTYPRDALQAADAIVASLADVSVTPGGSSLVLNVKERSHQLHP